MKFQCKICKAVIASDIRSINQHFADEHPDKYKKFGWKVRIIYLLPNDRRKQNLLYKKHPYVADKRKEPRFVKNMGINDYVRIIYNGVGTNRKRH